jgi:hypothetical protein
MAANAASCRARSPCADASRACDVATARKYACSSPARSAVGETSGAPAPLPPALTFSELTALAMDPNALKMDGLAAGVAGGTRARLGSRARGTRATGLRDATQRPPSARA